MHQSTVSNSVPDLLPEIKVETSTVGSKETPNIVPNESVDTAFKVVLNYLAETITAQLLEPITSQVLARIGAVPSTLVSSEPKVQKRQLSPEARKRISDSQKARWLTRTRNLSPEVKERISKAQKTRWSAKKGITQSTPCESSTATEADSQSQPNNPVVVEVETPKEATLAAREGYRGDNFYISEGGQFIGDDGFVVPKNFSEFFERYPRYLENWVRRRLGGKGIEEDIEDWVQELIIHMKYLPQTSKHRLAGKEDVIQTFDPFAQYGASERRWRSYVNYCLTNKFNTIFGKRQKNPVCLVGNVSLVAETNPDSRGEVTDEYAYSKSSYLTEATHREEKKAETSFFAHKFIEYVHDTDPDVFPVLEAVYVAGSATETVKEFCQTCKKLATTKDVREGLHEGHEIGMSQKEFNKARNRLKQLAVAFVKKKPKVAVTLTTR